VASTENVILTDAEASQMLGLCRPIAYVGKLESISEATTMSPLRLETKSTTDVSCEKPDADTSLMAEKQCSSEEFVPTYKST
jgi:hypothetical protein